MNTLVTKALEMRLAAFWFALFSVNSLCTCIVASMAGSVWSNLGAQEKFTVIVAIIGNWTGTVMAYVSKAAKRIESGQLPLNDTVMITKNQVDNGQNKHEITKQP